MKSKFLLTIGAMSMMLAGISQQPIRPMRQRHNSPSCPDIKPGIIPKGHRTGRVPLSFEKNNVHPSVTVIVHCEISYSNQKTALRKITKLTKQLQEFINASPVERLIKTPDFKVIAKDIK